MNFNSKLELYQAISSFRSDLFQIIKYFNTLENIGRRLGTKYIKEIDAKLDAQVYVSDILSMRHIINALIYIKETGDSKLYLDEFIMYLEGLVHNYPENDLNFYQEIIIELYECFNMPNAEIFSSETGSSQFQFVVMFWASKFEKVMEFYDFITQTVFDDFFNEDGRFTFPVSYIDLEYLFENIYRHDDVTKEHRALRLLSEFYDFEVKYHKRHAEYLVLESQKLNSIKATNILGSEFEKQYEVSRGFYEANLFKIGMLNRWLSALIILFISSLAYLGFLLYGQPEVKSTSLFVMRFGLLLIMPVPIWFCMMQYNKDKMIIEHYAHKKTIALTTTAFRETLAGESVDIRTFAYQKLFEELLKFPLEGKRKTCESRSENELLTDVVKLLLTQNIPLDRISKDNFSSKQIIPEGRPSKREEGKSHE